MSEHANFYYNSNIVPRFFPELHIFYKTCFSQIFTIGAKSAAILFCNDARRQCESVCLQVKLKLVYT